MHPEAYHYVADAVASRDLNFEGVEVLDLGGRDVNGTPQGLFDRADCYLVVDYNDDHLSVDIVADAATVELGETFDVVISTEVLEHTEVAPQIVANAYRHLRDGGVFVATMAGPGRAVHGADGGCLLPGEFYRNVDPDELADWMQEAGFAEWSIDVLDTDVRVTGVK